MSITVWVNTAAWEPADVVIHIQGMGTVLREKSLVAYEHESGKILAFGTEAERMFGMEEQGIRVVSPLRQGMVEDYAVAVQLFTCLLQKAVGKRSWRRPGIAVCVPRGITPVDKKAMEDALLQAGAKEVVLQEFPLKQFLMEEAEHLSDRIGIMANGNLVAVGTAEELIQKAHAKNFEDAFVQIATGGELA